MNVGFFVFLHASIEWMEIMSLSWSFGFWTSERNFMDHETLK